MSIKGYVSNWVGGLTVLSDAVTVEKIYAYDKIAEIDYYIRLTMCSDDGIHQSTWFEKKAPDVAVKLMHRLESLGSHVNDDSVLLGPHLMRGGYLRDIIQLTNGCGVGDATNVRLVEDIPDMDLEWLDELLHITRPMDEECE